MSQQTSSRVTTLVDIGLNASEIYVQFVPPSTFGVIYDRHWRRVYLVRANGERNVLRRSSDKVYVLRGFIGLRQRECRVTELGVDVEDEIIRIVLCMFGSLGKLQDAVKKYCSFQESAAVLLSVWAPVVFGASAQGFPPIKQLITQTIKQKMRLRMLSRKARLPRLRLRRRNLGPNKCLN
jgi:hypothetical protein